MTLLRACLGRCGRFTDGPRCPTCRRQRQRLYDAGRPAHHALYRSPEWRRLSAAVRAGADRCHWCAKRTTRLVADHVIPVELRPDLALDPKNVVPSCVGCNTRRGRNLRPEYRQVGMYEVIATAKRQEARR